MCYRKENKLFKKLKKEINKLSLIYPEAEIDIDINYNGPYRYNVDPYGYDEYAKFFYILLKNSISIYVTKNKPNEIKYMYHSQSGGEYIFNSYSEALELSQLNIEEYKLII